MTEYDFKIFLSGFYPHYGYDIEHLPDEFELQYVASGNVILEYGGQRYELEAGSFWVNHPGVLYRYRPGSNGEWEHRFIVFDGEKCKKWKSLGLIPYHPCQVPAEMLLAKRIDRIIELSNRALPLNNLEAMNMTEKILIDLRRIRDLESQSVSWVNSITSALDARHDLNPDYSALAAKYGMTRRSLFRNFKKSIGLTPHAYHIKTRIKCIMEMLEMTDLPIKVIADKAGYSDVFYFSRQFKQQTGLSPGQYRRRNSKKIKK